MIRYSVAERRPDAEALERNDEVLERIYIGRWFQERDRAAGKGVRTLRLDDRKA
jgi:hypothetical protein